MKFNLKSVKNGLSRDEMRTVKGGGSSCGECYSAYDCKSSCMVCGGGRDGKPGTCEAMVNPQVLTLY
jgi:hypothetical protein